MEPNSPELKSFIPVEKDSDFPVQNLPYGVYSPLKKPGNPEAGVAIGNQILSLTVLEKRKVLKTESPLFGSGSLNPFMEQRPAVWKDIRRQISELLRSDNPRLKDDAALRSEALLPMTEACLQIPVTIGDYTDFYSSREHATNVGTMFRDKNNPLLPNWLHLPVGYHGRASSVVVSGTPVTRPCGQIMPPDAEKPLFSPCKRLDFELEMAFFTGGPGNRLGRPVRISEAGEHIFGVVLMNDWSARDIQKWEYQPLGPFVSKSFATTISPWVVPMEALRPFAKEGVTQEPEPLEYLRIAPGERHHLAATLEVMLKTEGAPAGEVICRSDSRHLYWSMSQQLAHHTVTGCNIRAGDLMASGTISGTSEDSFGSLLELAWGGKKPLSLKSGESRTFLQDGDEVVMRGWCQGEGYRVGFGTCEGRILAAES